MSENYKVGDFYLDDHQMELLKNDTNTIVIAGAGSGKSLTILGKINYLIEFFSINPQNILVISFTNASVNDIKNKLKYSMDVFTFHKLAMHILERANINYSISSTNLLQYIIEESIKTANQKEQKCILKYLKIKIKFKYFLNTYEYQSFVKLIETFISLWKTNNLSFASLPLKKYNKLEKNILLFIFKILKKYNAEKNGYNQLDFDDLILMATEKVKNAKLKYQYIFIDEFQDSSFIRLNLIKEIVKHTNSKIIVVGDDWQSIYHFSGCDLKIFMNFTSYFSNVNTIKLLNTYRNSQELIKIASTFVMKNPLQIKKQLYSSKSIDYPLVFVPYKNKILTFKKILDYILNISDDVMILSRNNRDIFSYLDNEIQFIDNMIKYKNKELRFLSVHKSKGLEAKYVIVLNCNNDYLGFPNKIENCNLISKLYPDDEIKYAEERRLFYVAITRCKEKTYLLYNQDSPSIFIKEIKKISKKVLGKITIFH